MTTKLIPFDPAEFLTETEDQTELLAEAVGSGDVHIVAAAIGLVARAKGMTDLAMKTGIKRQALYRAFGENGNPTLETMLKVLPALGLQLKFEPVATT
jgi:probable addiction module antidote protein